MSFSYVMMLLYWLERLSLHALYAFEDWSHVKKKVHDPRARERERRVAAGVSWGLSLRLRGA